MRISAGQISCALVVLSSISLALHPRPILHPELCLLHNIRFRHTAVVLIKFVPQHTHTLPLPTPFQPPNPPHPNRPPQPGGPQPNNRLLRLPPSLHNNPRHLHADHRPRQRSLFRSPLHRLLRQDSKSGRLVHSQENRSRHMADSYPSSRR